MTWLYLLCGLYLVLVLASFFLDSRGRPRLPWRHEPPTRPPPPEPSKDRFGLR